MNAKDMFEKLNFKIVFKTKDGIVYVNQEDGFNIYFHICRGEKMIEFLTLGRGSGSAFLQYEELQAINQQIKELGWNDE